MKKALWFSRHEPTVEQIQDAARMGYTLCVDDTGTRLGSFDIRYNGDVIACVSALLGHCSNIGAVAIFGVPAAPVLYQMARTAEDAIHRGDLRPPAADGNGDFPFYAAWNISRSVDGGKPTFQHRRWVLAGYLNQQSLRWCQGEGA